MSIHDGTVVPYLYLLYIQYIKRWKAREPNYPSMQRPLSELDRIPLGILPISFFLLPQSLFQ